MYDVLIVGMGVAGITASIYLKRSGLKTIVLESMIPGGLLNKISLIENYPSFKSITGIELSEKLFEQVKDNEIEYKIEKVLKIEDNKDYKTVITSKNKYETKSVIISIGRVPRKSNILNEEKFIGKGISYCAICDGMLYRNKDILVLGGGNSAIEEALYLSNIVKSIKVIVRNDIKAEKDLVDRLLNKSNAEILKYTKIKEILGEDAVKGVKLENDEIISCDGIFIYYGYEADTNFIKNLNITDEKGYILVDKNMKTKVNNIYACGDIIKKDLYQIITAAAEGAIAANTAIKDIKNN